MDEAAWRAVFKELFEMSEMNFRFKGSPCFDCDLIPCVFTVFGTEFVTRALLSLLIRALLDLRRQRAAVQLRDESRFSPARALKPQTLNQ